MRRKNFCSKARTITIISCWMVGALCGVAVNSSWAVQQYVAGVDSTQAATNAQPTLPAPETVIAQAEPQPQAAPVASPSPADIYVKSTPPAPIAPVSASAPNVQAPAAAAVINGQPSNPSNPSAVLPSTQVSANLPVTTNAATAATSNTSSAPQQSPAGGDDERRIWFDSCMGAVKNQKLAAYAQEFCQCGWERINNAQFPKALLVSNNPSDLKKANALLVTISEECKIAVVAKYKL